MPESFTFSTRPVPCGFHFHAPSPSSFDAPFSLEMKPYITPIYTYPKPYMTPIYAYPKPYITPIYTYPVHSFSETLRGGSTACTTPITSQLEPEGEVPSCTNGTNLYLSEPVVAEFRFPCLGLGSGFRVQGSGYRVQGLGFRV